MAAVKHSFCTKLALCHLKHLLEYLNSGGYSTTYEKEKQPLFLKTEMYFKVILRVSTVAGWFFVVE
jgi:hypothetical protein